MKVKDMLVVILIVCSIGVIVVAHDWEIDKKLDKIIAQNDYITEVLLCNPINLVDDFGTDIIKEKK